MTNDKTVTLSRELAEHIQGLLDESQPGATADELRALLAKSDLADHCKQCADTVQTWPGSKRDCLGKIAAPVVERQPVACNHEWTDDGELTLACTKCGAQEDHDPHWRDMESAPRDGTMLRLLVKFEEHSTEDAEEAPTLGANNLDYDEIDEWKFAGWCWTHDHFTQGVGTPIGWLPLIEASPPAPVAAVMTMEDVMRANESVIGISMMTSNQCHALAKALTAVYFDKVKELNQ